MTIGAALGAVLAELLPGDDLGLLITGAVLLAFLLILFKLKQLLAERPPQASRYGAREFALFLAIGAWIGFIVLDGATYLLLALVLAVRLPLPEANAIKNFLLVPTSLVALAVFAADGSIHWTVGLVMGAGSMAGGLLGARMSLSPHARERITLVLTLVIVAELFPPFAALLAPLPGLMATATSRRRRYQQERAMQRAHARLPAASFRSPGAVGAGRRWGSDEGGRLPTRGVEAAASRPRQPLAEMEGRPP